MQRRQLLSLTAAGLAVLCLPALAQTDKRVRRIGYFSGGSVQSTASWLAAFRAGMAELRWVEGRDYVIDARHERGGAVALKEAAARMVANGPELIVTTAEGTALPIIQSTKTIPIVLAIASDPVANGFAASLRRPGGNVTGLSSLSRELVAKRVEMLKKAFPRVSRVAILYEPANANSVAEMKESQAAAARLKMRLIPIELRQAADIELAFKRGAALGAQAYMNTQGFLISAQRQAIADGSLRAKVPAIFNNSQFIEQGGLMSYGPSYEDLFRRAAGYVDKILKGAKPGELPIEQAAKFEMVLNLKTAKALGITFPDSILLRADRVIE